MPKSKAKPKPKPKPKPKKRSASRKRAAKGANVLRDYSGFLVVELRLAGGSPAVDRLEAVEAVDAVLKAYAVKPGSPLITSLSVGELKQREDKWKVPQEKSFSRYWRLDTRHLESSRVEMLRTALEQLDVVACAYMEGLARNPAGRSLLNQQGYLNAAPKGIGAKWAWRQPGGSGQGVRIVDLEAGWHTHDDLPALDLLPGVPREINGSVECKHGTMVLGVLAALKDGSGVVGISHDATISVASHWRADPTGRPSPVDPNACTRTSNIPLGGHVSDAILAVLDHLTRGDILLLEVERTEHDLPTESFPPNFDAIVQACNEGIVVIECAGNGSEDLDRFPELVRDSGAIVVAGCEAKVSTRVIRRPGRRTTQVKGHKPWIGSNFGSRIDCHAWAEKVATTGLDDSLHSIFVNNFTGTSAAGAIVAGAAAVVQSARKANRQEPLTPAQMRDVLRSTGTPQFPGPKKIGTMPNLKKAIPAALALP